MKHFLLFFSAFLACTIGYSQINNPFGVDKEFSYTFADINQSLVSDSQPNQVNLDKVDGSPYLSNLFENGSLKAEDGDELYHVSIRYNIYNDEMEISGNEQGKIQSLVAFEKYLYTIGKKSFIYREYVNLSGKHLKGYFQYITGKKVSLLLKYRSIYHPEEPGKPMDYKVTPAKFITKKDYYLLIDNQVLFIPKNKKKFFNLFGVFKNQVKTYVSKNKLKTSKESDLAQIIDYYNTLLE